MGLLHFGETGNPYACLLSVIFTELFISSSSLLLVVVLNSTYSYIFHRKDFFIPFFLVFILFIYFYLIARQKVESVFSIFQHHQWLCIFSLYLYKMRDLLVLCLSASKVLWYSLDVLSLNFYLTTHGFHFFIWSVVRASLTSAPALPLIPSTPPIMTFLLFL